MQALIFDTARGAWESSIGFEKADVPEPVIDEKNNPADAAAVIIKVHYAGVCGSDRGIWNRTAFRDQILGSIAAEGRGGAPGTMSHGYLAGQHRATSAVPLPMLRDIISMPLSSLSPQGLAPKGRTISATGYRILGHEFFGEVVSVGSAVTRAKVGDFATCESHMVCNACYQCQRGEHHVCTNEKILGISHDGGFCEYAKVPEHIVWVTDTARIRPEIAALQEPFGNAVHAASKVDLAGKTIALFGLGPIGMMLSLVIRGMGAAAIIGVDPNPVAREMAQRLGIDYAIPIASGAVSKEKPYAHDPAVTDEIMRITGGIGTDASFEMAGFNASVNNALFSTRRGGDIVLFGLKNGDFVFEDYNRLIVRGFTLHAVIGRQMWRTWETTKALLQDRANGIQNKLWNVVLAEGRDTIMPIGEYTKDAFEKKMAAHPKILLQF